MGKNHPALEDVRDQIEAVKEQLKALSTPGGNPFQADDVKQEIPKMSDQELRRAVAMLAYEVTDLRKRVAALERQGAKNPFHNRANP